MSDSVRPQRWQPTRLPRPWGSPGKNTGVGCHFLLQCMKVKSESEVAQSRRTLSDPMDCSLPGSSVHGIFQARVLEWGAIAVSRIVCLKMVKIALCYIYFKFYFILLKDYCDFFSSCSIYWLYCMACGILGPQSGIKPVPSAVSSILTTGLPEKSNFTAV